MTRDLSIVMPCHNRSEALRLTLASLRGQTVPGSDFEVLVVDQASTDGSRELVRAFDAPFQLRLLAQDAKYGISVARNAGVEQARSEFILLLDADLLADARLVEAHIHLHASRPAALLCGRVLPYPPAYASYVEQIANPEAGLDRGMEAAPLPFYQGFGGHLAFSKEIFTRVGPFDQNLKGFEDIDFTYRACQQGYALLNNTLAVSYHNHPRTLSQRFAQARAYNRMLPVLYARYPEIKGQAPLWQDYEPIHWRADVGQRLVDKLRVRAFGMPLVQYISQAALSFMDRRRRYPRLARFLYWQLLMGSGYLGFLDGAAALRR